MPPKAPSPEEEEEENGEVGSAPVPPNVAWTDLTLTDVQGFLATQTPEQSLEFIANKFGLADYEKNPRSTITVDLYLWILTFARDAGFNEEKTSAAFTILKTTHEFATAGGGRPVEETFKEFKRLVLQHSLNGVPDHIVLFTPSDVKLLTAYVTNSYMKHYRLYQYAAHKEQDKDQHSVTLFVCTPSDPPPLQAATMEGDEKAPEASADAEASEQPPAEEEAKPEESEEQPEKSEQEKIAEHIQAILQQKGKVLEDDVQRRMEIKMNTMNAKLAGLGL